MAFVAVLRHNDRCLRLLDYRVLRDRDLVDDALQDVALKAYRALPEFRGEASLGTWLHRLTHTTCLDSLRHTQSLELMPTDELPEACNGVAPDTAELVAERDYLRRRLAALPEAQAVHSEDPRFGRQIQELDPEARTAKALAARQAA